MPDPNSSDPNSSDPTPPDPGAPAPLVSILVISYNTRQMTLACLRTVVAETTVPHEIIVLDNASPDGSAAAIAAEFPGIRLIASPDNLGFAKGNNVAARQARGTYLLLLNPDTLVLDHALDRLAAAAEAGPQPAIWGGRTLYGDRSLNPTNCFGDQTLWSLFCRMTGLSLIFRASPLFNPEEYGTWDRGTERAVDIVSGCLFLMPRALWEDLGGFDLTFVMYGEEADLCRRARARGAPVRMTPEATIVHYVGASSNQRSDKEILVMKARATLIRRHLPAWQRPAARLFLRLWPLTRALGGRLLALATRGARGQAAAQHWGPVWRARAEWQAGFPDRGSPRAAERPIQHHAPLERPIQHTRTAERPLRRR